MAQEQELIDSLKEYIETAPEKVLNVWFQSPGLRQLKDAVRLAEEAEADDLDNIIALILHCDEVFLAVYHNLASSALSQEVTDVFQHLEAVRRQHGRDRTWRSSHLSI